MTAPDVAAIARGLTKAQRECVLSDRLPRFTTIYWQGSPGALHALKRKGLTSGPFADQPTPLGLAVRTYLQENPDG